MLITLSHEDLNKRSSFILMSGRLPRCWLIFCFEVGEEEQYLVRVGYYYEFYSDQYMLHICVCIYIACLLLCLYVSEGSVIRLAGSGIGVYILAIHWYIQLLQPVSLSPQVIILTS